MNKNWLIFITLLLVFITPRSYSVQNPSLSNPAGATTTPQSYYGNNLIDTSNPVDTSGNQIVTGNVRQGMSFRGNVPYSSPSSFHATLGSSSLSSFMRDSTGAEDIGRYRTSSAVSSSSGTNYQSYHLPSSTVTTMSPNRTGIAAQANPGIINNTQYAVGAYAQQSLELPAENEPAISSWNAPAQSQTLWQLYNPGLAATQTQYNSLSDSRQISQSSRQNQQLLPEQSRRYQQDQAATSQQYLQQRQTQQLTPVQNEYELTTGGQSIRQTEGGLNSTQHLFGSMTQNITPNKASQMSAGQYNTLIPYQSSNVQQDVSQPRSEGGTPSTQSTSEAVAQIQKQLDDLIHSINWSLENPIDRTQHLSGSSMQDITPDKAGQISAGQYTTTVQPLHSTNSDPALSGVSRMGQVSGNMTNTLGTSPRYQTENTYQPGQTGRDPAITTGSSRLQDIMKSSGGSEPQRFTLNGDETHDVNNVRQIRQVGHYEPQQNELESFSQAKYMQLYRAAEGHMNIGRFHQAADTFALAAIYNPNDPACYGGRGHALFAAGEYINSALLLIRAIELDPEYINTHIDLVELLGDAEDLNNKIAELNKWLHKSNAPGLGFLLGYVYYHTGRFNEAKRVMDIVAREMPNSTAAVALKMAINFKLKTQQQSSGQ